MAVDYSKEIKDHPLSIQVVPAEAAASVGFRWNINDSGKFLLASAWLQLVKQEFCQQHMPQVVDTKLAFKAIGGFLKRAQHHPSWKNKRPAGHNSEF